jgi:hypothetical protein
MFSQSWLGESPPGAIVAARICPARCGGMRVSLRERTGATSASSAAGSGISCAFSGKASNNVEIVIGRSGSTEHGLDAAAAMEDHDLPLWTEESEGEFGVDASRDFGKDLGRTEGGLVRFEEGEKLRVVAVVDVVVRMLVPCDWGRGRRTERKPNGFNFDGVFDEKHQKVRGRIQGSRKAR